MKELIKIILELASNNMSAIRRFDEGKEAEAFGLLGSNIRGVVEYFSKRRERDPEFDSLLKETAIGLLDKLRDEIQ